MRNYIPTSILLLFAASSINAATTFSATIDTDLNNALNWSNGLPSADNAGTISADGGMTADFTNNGLGLGGTDESLTVNASVTTGANELFIGGAGDKLYVGKGLGTTGLITVNDGGTLRASGTQQNVVVGTDGGFGTIIFEEGSTIDARKYFNVTNGLVSFAANVTTGQNGIQEDFGFGATATLQFEVNSSFENHTVQGSTVTMKLGTGSTLNLNFAATPTYGQTFKLVDDVAGYSGTSTTFTNVTGTGLGAGQSLDVTYGLNDVGLVVAVVPEPSSTVLSGLLVLGLALRRRR